MDQLKSEIKDKERHCHTIETTEAYARQETSQKYKDLIQTHEDIKDQLLKKERELKFTLDQLSDNKDKLREAEVQVKAYDLSTRFQKAEM